MDNDELLELMEDLEDARYDDWELDPESVVRCPECLWTETEVLNYHERTGVTTYECGKCYEEFRI